MAKRPGRATLNNALALGGVIIILLQVLFIAYTRVQVSVVLAGIMINQIGVWGLAARLLPERRIYLQLRAEVDNFIKLVRQLNTNVVEGESAEVEAGRTAMHESVDRIVSVAGKEN